MEPKSNEDLELAKLEYQEAINQYRHCSNLRRQDMVFVTTAQGAVLTIIGSHLEIMDLSSLLLSIIAFALVLLGFNSERRVSGYLEAYIARSKELEIQFSMSLISSGDLKMSSKRMVISNHKTFQAYYIFLMISWLLVWIHNI